MSDRADGVSDELHQQLANEVARLRELAVRSVDPVLVSNGAAGVLSLRSATPSRSFRGSRSLGVCQPSDG